MAIYFGNQKIKDIHFGSQKIKEVYKGSQLVYSAMFNGVLYDNGYEGVEWEQGITVGQGTDWLLDKSDNSLYAQVMGTSNIEAAWTTKNAIDLSSYNNLKIVWDRNISLIGTYIVGIFISTGKNNSANGNTTYINNTFNNYLYYGGGTSTDEVLNMTLNSEGEYYISVNAIKISAPQQHVGYIRVKELILE